MAAFGGPPDSAPAAVELLRLGATPGQLATLGCPFLGVVCSTTTGAACTARPASSPQVRVASAAEAPNLVRRPGCNGWPALGQYVGRAFSILSPARSRSGQTRRRAVGQQSRTTPPRLPTRRSETGSGARCKPATPSSRPCLFRAHGVTRYRGTLRSHRSGYTGTGRHSAASSLIGPCSSTGTPEPVEARAPLARKRLQFPGRTPWAVPNRALASPSRGWGKPLRRPAGSGQEAKG